MNCIDAREAMLTAEPDELAAVSISPLGEHLAACQSCRAMAVALTHDLDSLSALVRNSARTRRIHRATWIGALAAAAAIIAFVLPTRRESPSEDTPVRGVATGISVDVKPGQQAAVIATRDPKVTVVWIIQGGTH